MHLPILLVCTNLPVSHYQVHIISGHMATVFAVRRRFTQMLADLQLHTGGAVTSTKFNTCLVPVLHKAVDLFNTATRTAQRTVCILNLVY